MSQANIKRIGVLGSGQMGSGIAQVSAQADFETLVCDIAPESIAKAKERISSSLQKLQSKGLVENVEAIEKRLNYTTTLNDLASCDLIIEAVTENEALKLKIFSDLDTIASPHAILASNTSSLSLTKIASATKRPQQVIGMHFMNPVPVMTLVEVIQALQTSPETYQRILDVAQKMKKTVVTSQDSPGFIINRILMPMINEAIYALESGLGTKEDIDTGMKLGTNQPMGPLTLADFIGLDTVLSILKILEESHGNKFKPCPLLQKYVDAGWLGRKTKRGFYLY